VSKTIDALNAAGRQREQKNGNSADSVNQNNGRSSSSNTIKYVVPKSQVTKANNPWIFGLIILILLANLGLTLKLFLTMGDYPKEKKNIISKFSSIEKTAVDMSKQMDAFSVSLNEVGNSVGLIRNQAKDNNLKIAKVEKQLDANIAAVENLVKAKNTLFDRFNYLEVELNLLKDSNKEIKELMQNHK